jgi:hypothetical protein
LIEKSHFYLALIVGSLFGLPASAVTTSKNVDIIVTHGAPLTTFTFVNNTGATLPAGTPVSMGQAFRYGDIMPGNYPLIRDATTHIALSGQQWDEISTWRENGGNGSWRHAVWGIWLPQSVAAGATYQIEFVATPGTYSQSSHQALSELCAGPAAHDLKIHLTDVRNQDDTTRDSGDATFRVCDNIANTGRDAPRHLRSGNVYDEYEVSGLFKYTSGHQDPLLYSQCIVDIFTKASDGVSPGDTRWVCHEHNSWENVAAGSTGNAGNRGPAGFANDPQAISYRPEIDDGTSDVLDWSGLDATVSSASNPMQSSSGGNCDRTAGTYCMFIPSSTGSNAWYYGQATRASCSGTCVGAVHNGQLYYVWPSSSAVSSGVNTQYVALQESPWAVDVGTYFMTGAQGTGTTTFSTRFQHYHWETWQTLDATGQDNWSPAGTTTRTTRKIYPAFTAAEKRYWEASGLIVPLYLGQTPNVTPSWTQGLGLNYEPFGKLNVIGTTGTGARPDLGISNEWAAQAFITGAQKDWDSARLFTLGTSIHGYSTLLDEATGRIPVLNNGPPVGAGGNGVGAAYAALGTPQNALYWNAPMLGLTDVVHNKPFPQWDISGGTHHGGTYISHMPSFDGFTYAVFGDRHFLDLMQWQGNRDYLQQRPGPGPFLGQGYYRDNNAVLNGTTYHYYGLLIDCCQTRGSAWLIRDITYPATFGGDENIERSYFADFLTENNTYYPLWLAFKDGSGSTNYSTSIVPPDHLGQINDVADTYIESYVSAAAYNMVAFQHSPFGSQFAKQNAFSWESTLGAQLPGAPVGFYAIDFNLDFAIHNGDCLVASNFGTTFGGGEGPCYNGTDASDFGVFNAFTTIGTGGQLTNNRYDMSAGGTFKNMNQTLGVGKIDQLVGTNWYTAIGPFGPGGASFYVQCNSADHVNFPAQCPVAGAAFTDFTRGGVSIAGETQEQFKYRPLMDPGPGQGFVNNGYTQYGGQNINALHILGYDVSHAMANYNIRAGTAFYNSSLPSEWWDPSVVVPGLPPAHNGP